MNCSNGCEQRELKQDLQDLIFPGLAIPLSSVVEIAYLAADDILEIYTQDSSDWNIVEKKESHGPLTTADLKANETIVAGLNRLTPDIPILSEELEIPPYEQRVRWARYWCVDPLDGTKEFIKRNGEFTVNIGLVEGTRPVAGVVVTPVTGECAAAIVGQGAWYCPARGQPFEKIRVASYRPNDPGLVVISSRSHGVLSKEFLSRFTNPVLISKGSSLKFILVARGVAHLYPRFNPCCEWDTCAAHAVLLAAGGRIYQAEDAGEAELVYNKEDMLNPYFVAEGRREQD